MLTRPETIKIFRYCNSTVTVVDGPVKVIEGPATVQENFIVSVSDCDGVTQDGHYNHGNKSSMTTILLDGSVVVYSGGFIDIPVMWLKAAIRLLYMVLYVQE